MTLRRRAGTDPGQATVEFALILPLFALLVVALINVSVIVRDQMLADILARNAARVASTASTADEARALVTETLSESGRRDADWVVDIDQSAVTVRVELVPRASLLASSARWLVGKRRVVGSATFATEFEIPDH
jgi:Flp pilus assembly protein TadG